MHNICRSHYTFFFGLLLFRINFTATCTVRIVYFSDIIYKIMDNQQFTVATNNFSLSFLCIFNDSDLLLLLPLYLKLTVHNCMVILPREILILYYRTPALELESRGSQQGTTGLLEGPRLVTLIAYC